MVLRSNACGKVFISIGVLSFGKKIFMQFRNRYFYNKIDIYREGNNIFSGFIYGKSMKKENPFFEKIIWRFYCKNIPLLARRRVPPAGRELGLWERGPLEENKNFFHRAKRKCVFLSPWFDVLLTRAMKMFPLIDRAMGSLRTSLSWNGEKNKHKKRFLEIFLSSI